MGMACGQGSWAASDSKSNSLIMSWGRVFWTMRGTEEVGGASDGHSYSIGLLEGGKGTHHVFLSVQQATPGAFQVLNDCDDVRHDAELLLLLPPRECHTPSPPVLRASHHAVPGCRSSFFT